MGQDSSNPLPGSKAWDASTPPSETIAVEETQTQIDDLMAVFLEGFTRDALNLGGIIRGADDSFYDYIPASLDAWITISKIGHTLYGHDHHLDEIRDQLQAIIDEDQDHYWEATSQKLTDQMKRVIIAFGLKLDPSSDLFETVFDVLADDFDPHQIPAENVKEPWDPETYAP